MLAALFDLRDLRLQGVEVLLHRSQCGEHLALLLQFPFAFGLTTVRFFGGTLPFTFHAHFLGTLGLSQLRFEIRQLLAESFRLRTVLHNSRVEIADVLFVRLDLRLRLVQVGFLRATGHILPFGTAREEARSRSERGHDHQQYHYKHRIIEHTFDGITSSGTHQSTHPHSFARPTACHTTVHYAEISRTRNASAQHEGTLWDSICFWRPCRLWPHPSPPGRCCGCFQARTHARRFHCGRTADLPTHPTQPTVE